MNEILSFEDEAQAYAEIQAIGYHAMAFDFPAEENDLHWHDFDSVLYVTAGELTVSVESEDESVTCHRGTKIVATAGVVHRDIQLDRMKMAVLAFLAGALLPKRLCRLYLIWKKPTAQHVKIRPFSTSYRIYKLTM